MASRAHGGSPDGQPIRLAVDPAVKRPQRTGHRHPASRACPSGGADTIAGRVAIEPMGAGDSSTPEAAGSDLRVVVPREIKVKSGDAVSLRTDARETCVHVRERRSA